jgi:NADH-quinone oxidoreductase subunit M
MIVGASVLVVLVAVLTIIFFQHSNISNIGMLFLSSTKWYPSLNISYTVGVDGISILMLILSIVIMFTGIFSSWNIENMAREYFIWYCLLLVGVFGFFISIDLFTMVFFYEIALIPMYLLIGLWGSGEKEYSAMKLTLMLMGGSAFLIFGIIGIYYTSGAVTMNILEIAKLYIPIMYQRLFFVATFLGFGILSALFPFHTWSPDGHASAPTAVSMLHAGVLMKLGGYGCFRVAICLLPDAADELSWLFLILTCIGVIYGAFNAVVQTDLKYINAYSSVSHCGLVLFAILMMNKTATIGAFMQMLSHGLMTALFFSLIGSIYTRTHTRDIRKIGGIMKVMPFISVCYVIAGLTSLGLPGLSGFISEMTIFVGSFQHSDLFHRTLTIITCCSIVIAAVYILQMIGKIFYGVLKEKCHIDLIDATWYEKLSAICLITGIVIIGIYPLWPYQMISNGLALLFQNKFD